jgi:hypothetical protein
VGVGRGGLAFAGLAAAAAAILLTVGKTKPLPTPAAAAQPEPAREPVSVEPPADGWRSLGTDDFSDPESGWLA